MIDCFNIKRNTKIAIMNGERKRVIFACKSSKINFIAINWRIDHSFCWIIRWSYAFLLVPKKKKEINNFISPINQSTNKMTTTFVKNNNIGKSGERKKEIAIKNEKYVKVHRAREREKKAKIKV